MVSSCRWDRDGVIEDVAAHRPGMSVSSPTGHGETGRIDHKPVDPFSGMGKAMPSFDNVRSPLPFGAVPHAHLPVRDADSPDGRHLLPSGAPASRIRKEREPLPEVFPSPQYSLHSPGAQPTYSPAGNQSPATRVGNTDFGLGRSQNSHRFFRRTMSVSSDSAQMGFEETDVGSDEWMARRVAECVDQAKGDVNMSGLGLTRLSSNIAELRDLVTLSTRSPPPTPLARLSPSINSRLPSLSSPPVHTQRSQAGPSPYAEVLPQPLPQPQSARGTTAFSNRQFGRTSSAPVITAPASSNFFHRLNNASAKSQASPPLADPSALQPSPSIDASASGSGLGQRSRTFGRSKTTKETLIESPVILTSGNSGVKLNISNNQLSKLPSALFEVRNLTMLSLRHNNLEKLPAGIGELENLGELNIANNQLQELPATIMKLRLNAPRRERSDHQAVRHFPNPWRPCVVEPHPQSGKYLGPLQRHYPASQTVPTLVDLCWMVALSPRYPDNVAPLVNFDFEVERGRGHPLNDSMALQEILSLTDIPTIKRVQQAARSSHAAAKAAASKHSSMASIPQPTSRLANRQASFARNVSGQFLKSPGFTAPSLGHYPSIPFGSSSGRHEEEEDASLNPFFEPCPSPRHKEYDDHADMQARPSRRVFLHPAEERLEWREVLGLNEKLPIRWKGCSPGCLDFLEEGEDHDVDGFDLSDTELDE